MRVTEIRLHHVSRLAVLALASACGGDTSSPNPPPAPPPPAPVATVTVAASSPTIAPGETTQLAATTKDAAGNTLNGRTVSWTTNAPSVATVDGNGLVTGVADGIATITATSEGKSGSAQVTVIAPVARVTVTPATASVVVGRATQLAATPLDAANKPLTGRTVTWTTGNPAVATVSPTGLVTAVGAGTATISASAEGKTGTAEVTVLEPVTSVVLTGVFRVKVGDTYSYAVTARLADGTVVHRPVTWSVLEPGKGIFTLPGVLTPLATGIITLVVTIDDTDWATEVTGYDWIDASNGGHVIATLASDATITNKFGTSEYPRLAVGCTPSGYLFVWVSTNSIVTHNGLVAYSFDGGGSIVDVWDELGPEYRSLWHPGPTNAERRGFAALLALARRWAFAFTEFNSTAKGMLFRVTGLDQVLPVISAACPSNSLLVGRDTIEREIQMMQASPAFRAVMGAQAAALASAEAALRAQAGPAVGSAPLLGRGVGQAPAETRALGRRP